MSSSTSNSSSKRKKTSNSLTIAFSGETMAILAIFFFFFLISSASSNHLIPSSSFSDPSPIHIAMTLDLHYLRGSIAAVHSILRHTSRPDSLFFHFITSDSNNNELSAVIHNAFPSLRFKSYQFLENRVRRLISSSIRPALETPLNYARNYLSDLLPSSVRRVIYLDSDILVVDDIKRLWDSGNAAFDGAPAAAVAAPEYCHTNISRYFTSAFWKGPWGKSAFEGRRRKPCYFNTGVMVMDLERWRAKGYSRRIERWMEVQKRDRIYDLGSLPPFLLVFAGEIEGLDHRWNQHGLGGDNLKDSCRVLHPGPVSLLHWSGKGKPWDRMDGGKPCPVDHLWKIYDLFSPAAVSSSRFSVFIPSSRSSSVSL